MQSPTRHNELRERSGGTANWLRSPVRQSTNRTAPDYLERRWFHSRATRWDYRMTKRTLLDELRPTARERLLEIGCGPGTWTREVAARSREVVAVDISENMIAEAHKFTQGLPVNFIHSDFLAAEPEGAFDKIYSARAIEYIRDRDLLAKKIASLLAPGGTVVLITKTRISIWRGRTRLLYKGLPFAGRLLDHSRPEAPPGVHQYLPSPAQLVRAFAPYGLVPLRVRPIVLRLPIFMNGFHEYPLVPDLLAPPLLAPCTLLHQLSARIPKALSAVPLFFSESFCITLRRSGSLRVKSTEKA